MRWCGRRTGTATGAVDHMGKASVAVRLARFTLKCVLLVCLAVVITFRLFALGEEPGRISPHKFHETTEGAADE